MRKAWRSGPVSIQFIVYNIAVVTEIVIAILLCVNQSTISRHLQLSTFLFEIRSPKLSLLSSTQYLLPYPRHQPIGTLYQQSTIMIQKRPIVLDQAFWLARGYELPVIRGTRATTASILSLLSRLTFQAIGKRCPMEVQNPTTAKTTKKKHLNHHRVRFKGESAIVL